MPAPRVGGKRRALAWHIHVAAYENCKGSYLVDSGFELTVAIARANWPTRAKMVVGFISGN